MKTKFSLLCDYASRDIFGKAMMIGVFDSINAASVPFLHPVFYYAFCLEASSAENGQHQFSIRLYENETKEEISNINDNFTLSVDGEGNHTIVIGFNGTVFPRIGVYILDFFIDGEHFASERLKVNLIKNQIE